MLFLIAAQIRVNIYNISSVFWPQPG